VAVDDLHFDARAGEILALLGPNGAGKTTTLLCLAGLLRPNAGQMRWQRTLLGPQRGRMMALIPETPEVYEGLTVWEHMVFVARSCRLGNGWEARAEYLLERLAIEDRRDTLGAALSKGMRQKLLIACAAVAATPVLLLDEPMIGLDPQGQRELRRLLLEVRSEGAAVIVSTHLLEYVDTFADRLLILKEGRAQALGTIAELRGTLGDQSLEELFFRITE
jgi:ABC-2 type transport system ATP-binding protein